MHATDALTEADRLMTVCNACRYCEGLCAVFPAMELRRKFLSADLNYLSNLCHGCGACFDDCQFTPPHEFQVNVPKTLARVRAESYQAYTWPRALSGLFKRNGWAVAIFAVLSVAAFVLGFILVLDESTTLYTTQFGPGAFYRLMPHNAMAALFGATFLGAIFALTMSLRAFWCDIEAPDGSPTDAISLWQAMKDASKLRYLDGGGVGCMNAEERPTDRRRLYHHLTYYGFISCFAATVVATLYHYLLGREAPFPWYDAPVLLGTAGGVGLLIGCMGLLVAKWRRRAELWDATQLGMDVAFITMLFLTSLTGLALLVLRATPAMAILLALHLGVVFCLFITMPYGKFVHGLYRFVALVRYAQESHNCHAPISGPRED